MTYILQAQNLKVKMVILNLKQEMLVRQVSSDLQNKW